MLVIISVFVSRLPISQVNARKCELGNIKSAWCLSVGEGVWLLVIGFDGQRTKERFKRRTWWKEWISTYKVTFFLLEVTLKLWRAIELLRVFKAEDEIKNYHCWQMKSHVIIFDKNSSWYDVMNHSVDACRFLPVLLLHRLTSEIPMCDPWNQRLIPSSRTQWKLSAYGWYTTHKTMFKMAID
jgi:hypothetical protein